AGEALLVRSPLLGSDAREELGGVEVGPLGFDDASDANVPDRPLQHGQSLPGGAVASSVTSPSPSMAKRTRSPGTGNLVVMLLPVITIMPRSSRRPRRFRRLAPQASASSGWPMASPAFPSPAGASFPQARVTAVSRFTLFHVVMGVPSPPPPFHVFC